MKIKTLILFTSIICLSGSNAMSTQRNDDDVGNHRNMISRKSFTLVCGFLGANCGANWTVDHTTKFIHSLHSDSKLFDLTFGSFVRGKTIIEAIPLAERYGASVGCIMGVSLLAPFILDYMPIMTSSVISSISKITRFFFVDGVPMDQRPSARDYVKGGLPLVVGGLWALCSAL